MEITLPWLGADDLDLLGDVSKVCLDHLTQTFWPRGIMRPIGTGCERVNFPCFE